MAGLMNELLYTYRNKLANKTKITSKSNNYQLINKHDN